MNLKLPLIVVTLALATGASAQPLTAPLAHPDRQCFSSAHIENFSAPSEQQALIRIGAHDVYSLDFDAPCYNLESARSIKLLSHGGSLICLDSADAELIVPTGGAGAPTRCLVKAVRRMTPAEIALVKKRDRP